MQSINSDANNASAAGMDADARVQIERELEPGERLRWCARANPGRLAKNEVGAVVFAIPFLLFSILWTVGVSAGRGLSGGTLFGLVFCAFGLWIMTIPLRAFAAGKSTFYGVTDRRAIEVSGASRRTVKSWGRREFQRNALTRTDFPDGTGDVIFAQETRRGSKGRRYQVGIGFFGIADARYVESLIRDLVE